MNRTLEPSDHELLRMSAVNVAVLDQDEIRRAIFRNIRDYVLGEAAKACEAYRSELAQAARAANTIQIREMRCEAWGAGECQARILAMRGHDE